MKGWTVLFFLYVEDEETAGYANELYKELIRIQPSEHLRLLMFESIYDPGDAALISGTLYELTHPGKSIKRTRIPLKKFSKIDPGSKNVLASVLKYIQKNKLLNDRFLLFTWDHGAGFGIFSNDPRPDTERNLLRSLTGISEPTSLDMPAPAPVSAGVKVFSNRRTRMLNQQPMNSVGLSRSTGFRGEMHMTFRTKEVVVPVTMLTATEINDALKVLDQPVDLMIMMNCWVQMLETGYELSESVKILVAPETIYYFAGYDYFTILNSISRNPLINEEELAKVVVKSIAAHFEEDIRWRSHLAEVVVSAVYPNKAEELVKNINQLFKPLETMTRKQFRDIQAHRRKSIDFSSNYYFDDGKPDNSLLNYFIDFVNYGGALAANGLVNVKDFSRVQASSKKYVKEIFRGNHFEKEGVSKNTFLANGFSIFHPDKRSPDFDDQLYYPYFYQEKRIKMANTAWAAFLEAYRTMQ